MKQIGIRWPTDLVERVDACRNGVSRSEFIRRAVEDSLAREPEVVARSPKPESEGSTPSTGADQECTHRNARKLKTGRWFCDRCREFVTL